MGIKEDLQLASGQQSPPVGLRGQPCSSPKLGRQNDRN